MPKDRAVQSTANSKSVREDNPIPEMDRPESDREPAEILIGKLMVGRMWHGRPGGPEYGGPAVYQALKETREAFYALDVARGKIAAVRQAFRLAGLGLMPDDEDFECGWFIALDETETAKKSLARVVYRSLERIRPGAE